MHVSDLTGPSTGRRSRAASVQDGQRFGSQPSAGASGQAPLRAGACRCRCNAPHDRRSAPGQSSGVPAGMARRGMPPDSLSGQGFQRAGQDREGVWPWHVRAIYKPVSGTI